jgi:enamine deaminase RidA (YjgF/YER057c/UK114 family)
MKNYLRWSIFVLISIFGLISRGHAQSALMHLEPSELNDHPNYTNVIIAETGRTIYIAGMVAREIDGSLVGKDDIEAQTRKIFENIRIALEAAGAGIEDIVRQRLFIVDIGTHRAQVGPLLAEFYGDVERPTSTAIGVPELMTPDALIEIEVTAVIN